MTFSAVAQLNKAGSDFVKRLKGEAGEAEARELLKKLGPIEKATAAFDKAAKAKDAKAVRAAEADVTNAIKAFAGHAQVLNAKLQKAGHADAGGIVGWFLGDLTGSVQQRCNQEAQAALDALKDVVKLPATTFTGDWKEAKKRFEALTGKKKPASSFLAVFRKSQGLDSSCADMDKASKANDPKAFRTALVAFVKNSTDYMNAVSKECKIAVDHKNTKDDLSDELTAPDYKKCVEALMAGLNKIRIEAVALLKEAEKK